MELILLTPNFLTSSSRILKEIYIQKRQLFLFYQFCVLSTYFLYNTFHYPFKEVVYIFFCFPNFFFEVDVWWETTGLSSLPSLHEEPPSLSLMSKSTVDARCPKFTCEDLSPKAIWNPDAFLAPFCSQRFSIPHI